MTSEYMTASNGKNFAEDINVYFGSKIYNSFSQGVWGQPIYNGNVTFVYDNADANALSLGAKNRTVTYNGNIAINIKKGGRASQEDHGLSLR
jgi:hypothetical protein